MTDKLQKTTGELLIPAYAPTDAAQVNESFEPGELKLPMLRICQAGTPQRKRGEPNFIEGLNEGDFFNDLTGQNYGVGPLNVVKLKFWTNFIRFTPMELGGGIICRDREHGGACPFPCPVAGDWKEGHKPECTTFYNYLFYLPATDETVWFSAKSTHLKPMRLYNSYLRLPKLVAIGDYAKVAQLTSRLTHNTLNQSYYVPQPSQVIGFVPEERLRAIKELALSFRDTAVDTTRAETSDEIVEGEPATTGTKDDIPF